MQVHEIGAFGDSTLVARYQDRRGRGITLQEMLENIEEISNMTYKEFNEKIVGRRTLMTNEQRKIISGLNALIRDRESFITDEDEKDNIFVQDKIILIEATELIKEQEKQVENVKALYDRALSDLVKADKQIDLMADFMYKTGTGRKALSCVFRQNDECNENGCKYCIKRYFANLIEKEDREDE